jgi:hypothetical protein
MDGAPPGIRRMCIAVAAHAPDGCDAAGAYRAQVRGSAALGEACRSAGLDRVLVNAKQGDRAPRGDDAMVALLPAGIDEPRAITALVRALDEELRRANGSRDEQGRVRLRMAVHEGVTMLTAGGFAGRAVDRARQLACSPPLHAALRAYPEADLIVLLSGQVYDDVTQFGDPYLAPDLFQRAEITSPARGYRDTGWIYVPRPAMR